MASLVLTGDTSGQVTISAPAVAGTNTLTLQAATATNSVNTLATAVASTSGTSIDFTGLPSWIKKITVMFQDVSSNGTSNFLIQLGDSGGIENTGYLGAGNTNASATIYTTGFGIALPNFAGTILQGAITIQNITGNSWIASGGFSRSDSATAGVTAGSKTLSATLDRVRITTVNGTDTFDAGTVNILYEG